MTCFMIHCNYLGFTMPRNLAVDPISYIEMTVGIDLNI